MAKRTSTTYLTPGEQVAGAVLFVIYLLVLPFAAGPLFSPGALSILRPGSSFLGERLILP